MRLKHYNQVRFIDVRAEAAQLSLKTGKPVKMTLSTSIRRHMLVYDHKIKHKVLKFLGNESNRYLLEPKISLFINRDKESLNKNLHPQEILLF